MVCRGCAFLPSLSPLQEEQGRQLAPGKVWVGGLTTRTTGDQLRQVCYLSALVAPEEFCVSPWEQ